jgi:transglutaminase-like putative cysteine protease
MRLLAAVPLALSLLAVAPAAAPVLAQEFGPARPVTVREFVLTYDVRVKDVPKGAKSVRVWLPMPMSTVLQEVSNPRIDPAATPIRFVSDDPYGTRFLLLELSPPPEGGTTAPVTVAFTVLRKGYRGLAPLAGQGSRVPPERWLAADPRTPVDGAVAAAARAAVGDATDPVAKARRLFDALLAGVKLDPSGESWGAGDAASVLAVKAGGPRDLAALFVGEARSVGIPARYVSGFVLPPAAKEGSLVSDEAWAEIRLEGKGWLPVDVVAAQRAPDAAAVYFGAVDEHRAQIALGRDVKVPEYPGPKQEIVAWPLAAVDGAAVPPAKVDTALRFSRP